MNPALSPIPTLATAGPALVFRPAPTGPVAAEPVVTRPAGFRPAPTGPVAAEVYRRRRLVALAVVIGLVLGLMSFGRQAGANRPAEAEAADAVTVVVQPGDTLWEIARTFVPGEDPRPLADALADLAGGTSLQPGQRIVVPGPLID